jgi:hypothetical protein
MTIENKISRRSSTPQQVIDKLKVTKEGIYGVVHVHGEVIKRVFDYAKAEQHREHLEKAGFVLCAAVRCRLHRQVALDLFRFGDGPKLVKQLSSYECPTEDVRLEVNKLFTEVGLSRLVAGLTGRDNSQADLTIMGKISTVSSSVGSYEPAIVDRDTKQDLLDFSDVTDISSEEATKLTPKQVWEHRHTHISSESLSAAFFCPVPELFG